LGESQQGLSEARIRLAALQNEISEMKNQPTTFIIAQDNRQEPNDLVQMKAQLENLMSRYTDRHPDVIRLKARIAELEKQVTAGTEGEGGTDGPATSGMPLPPQYRAQQTEIKEEIARLEADVADTKTQIAFYQQRIENTPKREQELLSLRRDYENIKATYSSLLSRKLESEIAVNMERKQKGEQFRVIDTARFPEKPIKPDMKKLFIMVVGAGLGIGAGIIFLLEYLDNSFKRPEDIESALGLNVLCTVPQIVSKKTQIWRYIERIGCAGVGAMAMALFAVFAVLSLKGVDQTVDLVKKVIN
jgi:polysaccharide chain length determinant protein (PEP-CTERM system associated)